MTINDINEDFDNFLGGTFHQDIESPEAAVEEYISRVSKEWLLQISFLIEEFVQSDLPEQEKAAYVEDRTDIYFPAIGINPIEWLKNVALQFKEAAKEKD